MWKQSLEQDNFYYEKFQEIKKFSGHNKHNVQCNNGEIIRTNVLKPETQNVLDGQQAEATNSDWFELSLKTIELPVIASYIIPFGVDFRTLSRYWSECSISFMFTPCCHGFRPTHRQEQSSDAS